MKKILLSLGLLTVLAFSAYPQASPVKNSVTSLNVATNAVLTSPYRLLSVSILSTDAQTLTFYDSASTNCIITNAAYTTRISYTTNYTNINSSTATGVPQTNIITGTYTQVVTNSAATNALPIIYTAIVSAGVAFNDPNVNLDLQRGLAVNCPSTNATTLAIKYRSFVP